MALHHGIVTFKSIHFGHFDSVQSFLEGTLYPTPDVSSIGSRDLGVGSPPFEISPKSPALLGLTASSELYAVIIYFSSEVTLEMTQLFSILRKLKSPPLYFISRFITFSLNFSGSQKKNIVCLYYLLLAFSLSLHAMQCKINTFLTG